MKRRGAGSKGDSRSCLGAVFEFLQDDAGDNVVPRFPPPGEQLPHAGRPIGTVAQRGSSPVGRMDCGGMHDTYRNGVTVQLRTAGPSKPTSNVKDASTWTRRPMAQCAQVPQVTGDRRGAQWLSGFQNCSAPVYDKDEVVDDAMIGDMRATVPVVVAPALGEAGRRPRREGDRDECQRACDSVFSECLEPSIDDSNTLVVPRRIPTGSTLYRPNRTTTWL